MLKVCNCERIVGACAARYRAAAINTWFARSAGLGTDEAELIESRLNTLNRVEIAVLAQQQVAHLRHQLFRRAAAHQVLSRQRTGLIHLLLQVEQLLEIIKQALRIRDRRRLRQAHQRQIQKAVEINAHRRVKYAARQIGRFHPLQALMYGVCECEGMQGRVPIPEFVAGMKMRDPAGGRIGDDAGQIDRLHSLAQAIQERVDNRRRIIAQQGRHEIFNLILGTLRCAKSNSVWDLGEGLVQNRDQINRFAPGV